MADPRILLTAALCLGGMAVFFALSWWDQRGQVKRWRDAYDRIKREHDALVAGAPITLVNVCRECQRLIRGDH